MKVKEGGTRVVFYIGKYAIKIATFKRTHAQFLQGCYANFSERSFCKLMSKRYSINSEINEKLVAPSLWCSWFGLLQIQMKVEILDRRLNYDEQMQFADITDDWNPVNFGIYQNRIVCVDYP